MNIRLGIRIGGALSGAESIEKAKVFKYIRRVPAKNPTAKRKWYYIYAETFKKPLKFLDEVLGVKKPQVEESYKKNDVKKRFGANIITFAAHILEYLTNRLKWDKIFAEKENRAKYKKPVKQSEVTAAASRVKGDLFGTKEKPPLVVNRSMMREVWALYNPADAKLAEKEDRQVDPDAEMGYDKTGDEDGGENSVDAAGGELPDGGEAVRSGGGGGTGEADVLEAEYADNGGESLQRPGEPGQRPRRNVRSNGRAGLKQLREQIKKLLAEKSDGEFTEADKELLRQYEGGGGLAEKDATTHGTLYEFYTPQKVVDKVWELVDKYNPRADKSVIEPSAGTGRFAEGRSEKFDLFELDETSARIAGILHPDANVKQGYFQDLFMNGRIPKKSYEGKKYDVAIGNPPYGKYSGLHRGLGEGKEHARIEEYFIDRSLDTLKDGGILAMVVPSGFLRNGSSKAKEKIAGKAELLEAWRLPNGTFGTTGIGTDIIVLRKGKGDPAQFSNNAYFDANETHIIGYETEKLGRFGMEKYVSLPEGVGFDEALESIDPAAVPAIPEEVPAVEAKESEAEEHQNRSEAMMGNQNAYKGGPMDEETAREAKENADFLASPGPRKWAELMQRSEALKEQKTNFLDRIIPYEKYAPRDKDGNLIISEMLRERREEEIMHHTLSNERDEKTRKRLLAKERELHKDYEAFHKSPEAKFDYQRYYRLAEQQESEAEAHANRSEAMLGNDNAAGSRGGKEQIDDLKKRIRALEKERDDNYKLAARWDKADEDILAQQHRNAGNRKQAEIDALKRELAVLQADNPKQPKETGEQKKGRKKKSDDDYVPSIGKNMTAAEYNKKYDIVANEKDLAVWRKTDFDGRIEADKLTAAEKKHMEESGNFTHDGEGNWYANANYASGNIYDRLEELEKNKEVLGETRYKINKSLLEAAMPAPKPAESIHVSPISDFAKTYEVVDEEGNEYNLREAFLKWAQVRSYGYGRRSGQYLDEDNSPISEFEIPQNINFNDVLDYIRQIPVKTDRATAREDSMLAKMERAKKQDARRECAERLFNRFIREGLPTDQRDKLVHTWNRRYNAVVNPDYRKVPVFVEGMNTHKGEKEFNLLPEQMGGISFLCNKGNGILAHEVGVGKGHPMYEKILTPKGWVTMGDIKPGSTVIAVDGKPAKVTKIFPLGKRDIYKVSFSDGSSVDCTEDHLWTVRYPWSRTKIQNPKGKSGWVTKELKELLPDIKNKRNQNKLSIPMTEPVQFEKKELPLDPYLLGVLIGDGCIKEHSVGVSLPDTFIKEKVVSLLPEGVLCNFAGKTEYRLAMPKSGQSNPIINALRELELDGHKSYEKFIPDNYKYGSIEDRIALLNGLMDTDGYVDSRGTTSIYYTTSEKLAYDFKEIVQSLGGTVSIKTKIGKYRTEEGNLKECRICYCISIRLNKINPFTLPRKAERVKEKCKYFPARFIDNVVYIGKSEAQCIMVDHPEHLYLTRDYVVTHNTVQLEAAMVNQLTTGRAKRPLTIVPKAVYRKWIKEYHQHFPDVKINELGNFSDIGAFMNRSEAMMGNDNAAGEHQMSGIPEGSISVCTYEALQKITFKDETISTALIDDMTDSQTIYDEGKEDKRSPKEIAEFREKMMEKLGKGTKAKEGAVFWEDLGFDCIGVDECHNFKNIFGQSRVRTSSVKDDEGGERAANEYSGLASITPSDRAVKLFAISQLVQRQNEGKNVFGLSATPFTNSPIEVYNILSLVARNKLKQLGIYNMNEFLNQFAEVKSEWAVSAQGDIVEKQVMKRWKNLGALQNLITEYMDYVEADEAGVIRPRKKVHLPQLELTPMQKAIIKAETEYMQNADPQEDPGATLKAINNMRLAALSPAAIDPSRYEYYRGTEGWPENRADEPRKEDFVKHSPKMKFVCDSVAKAYKKLPDAGQIIYLPRGVNDFVHVKQYLMDRGMPEDSIAFMSSKTSLDEKERIKKDFNDKDGKIKVIIGSETIKEGVSLNGNTHTIYNCMLGWNPTETTQVEGRAWRQGNEQGNVHIVYPLMADSIDALMYQKYDEKSSRINEIWRYKGDTSGDVSDINPEELKFDLIKDPAKKAKLIVGQKMEAVVADRRIEEARYEVLAKDKKNYESASEELPEAKKDMDVAEAQMKQLRERRDAAKKAYDKAKTPGEKTEAKNELDDIKWDLERAESNFRTRRKIWKQLNDDSEMYLAKFKKLGVKPNKIDEKLKEIAAGIAKFKSEEESIKGSYDYELEKAKRELETKKAQLPPLGKMIEANVEAIMGDLRPMDEVKAEIKAEMAAKKKAVKKALHKAFVIIGGRLLMVERALG